jgi:hypothetical protein
MLLDALSMTESDVAGTTYCTSADLRLLCFEKRCRPCAGCAIKFPAVLSRGTIILFDYLETLRGLTQWHT